MFGVFFSSIDRCKVEKLSTRHFHQKQGVYCTYPVLKAVLFLLVVTNGIFQIRFLKWLFVSLTFFLLVGVGVGVGPPKNIKNSDIKIFGLVPYYYQSCRYGVSKVFKAIVMWTDLRSGLGRESCPYYKIKVSDKTHSPIKTILEC